MAKRKTLNQQNFDILKDHDHILLLNPKNHHLITLGSIQKRELSETTHDNAIVMIVTHPDGSSFGLTAYSIRSALYEYDKGRVFVLNESHFI